MQAPELFKLDTQKYKIQLPNQTLPTFGQFWRAECIADGYLSDLTVMIQGVITTGTNTSGAFRSDFFPWNIINRFNVSSNAGGTTIFDVDGYHTMLITSLRHRGFQNVPTPPMSGGWNNTSNVGPRTAVALAPSGNLADSTPYPFEIMFKIPITIDDGLGLGLMLLQNQATVVQITGQVGVASDFTAGSLGSGATITGTVTIRQRGFSYPGPQPELQPNLDYLNQWLQQDVAWTASGEQIYNMPIGGTLSKMIIGIVNNGSPQPFFATASNPATPNLGQFKVQYAGGQVPINEDFRFMLFDHRENYGFDLPQGLLVFDCSLGAGSEELGFDGRDTFDTDQLANFTILPTINVTPTAGIIHYVRNVLRNQRIAA